MREVNLIAIILIGIYGIGSTRRYICEKPTSLLSTDGVRINSHSVSRIMYYIHYTTYVSQIMYIVLWRDPYVVYARVRILLTTADVLGPDELVTVHVLWI